MRDYDIIELDDSNIVTAETVRRHLHSGKAVVLRGIARSHSYDVVVDVLGRNEYMVVRYSGMTNVRSWRQICQEFSIDACTGSKGYMLLVEVR